MQCKWIGNHIFIQILPLIKDNFSCIIVHTLNNNYSVILLVIALKSSHIFLRFSPKTASYKIRSVQIRIAELQSDAKVVPRLQPVYFLRSTSREVKASPWLHVLGERCLSCLLSERAQRGSRLLRPLPDNFHPSSYLIAAVSVHLVPSSTPPHLPLSPLSVTSPIVHHLPAPNPPPPHRCWMTARGKQSNPSLFSPHNSSLFPPPSRDGTGTDAYRRTYANKRATAASSFPWQPSCFSEASPNCVDYGDSAS